MSRWETESAESILIGAAHNRSVVGVMVGIDLHIKSPAVAAEYMRLAEEHMSARALAEYRELRDIMQAILDVLGGWEE